MSLEQFAPQSEEVLKRKGGGDGKRGLTQEYRSQREGLFMAKSGVIWGTQSDSVGF